MNSTIIYLNNPDRSANASLTGIDVRAQVRRKHRRIRPLPETQRAKPKKKISRAFNLIFTFGLFIGLPISSSLYSSRRQHCKKFVINALLKTWMFANTVFFALESAYSYFLFETIASRMSYFVQCLSGHVLMWIFLLNRREMKDVVIRLCRLSSSLNFDADGVETRIKTYMAVAVLHAAASVSIQWRFLFYDEWSSTIENIRVLVPFEEDSVLYHPYNRLVFFSAMCSFNMSMLTLYFTIFLCSEAYRTSGRLFVLFGKKLHREIEKGSFTATTANVSISQYKSISSCVSRVDDTFGMCALVVFADMSNQFFGAASLFLAQDLRLQSKLVTSFGTLFLAMGFVMLCYLVYSGEKVREGSRILSKRLVGMSHSLVRCNPDTQTLVMFNLLARDIKSAGSCITVMGLFEITTQSLLSILSMLVTYNAMLYQLGVNAKS